jgi:transcriptional regulator with XRE-family HTH domain
LTVLIVRGHKVILADDYGVDSVLVRFGNRVRELRKKKGLSQEGLALESGLDRSYVGGVERGERNISLENIEKLARALRVHPSELLRNQERTK